MKVSLFAERAFNKLYKLSVIGQPKNYILRVALPVYPRMKTEIEVAAMELMRNITNLVPDVVAFGSQGGNELGFEWIIMEMNIGMHLRNMWRKMAWEKKTELIRLLAQIQAKMFDNTFAGVGNLYSKPPTAYFRQRSMIGDVVRKPLDILFGHNCPGTDTVASSGSTNVGNYTLRKCSRGVFDMGMFAGMRRLAMSMGQKPREIALLGGLRLKTGMNQVGEYSLPCFAGMRVRSAYISINIATP